MLDKKKNEIYEETRIAIFLGGLPVDMSGLALRESDGANRAFLYTESGFSSKGKCNPSGCVPALGVPGRTISGSSLRGH